MPRAKPNLLIAQRLRERVPWGAAADLAERLHISGQRLSQYLLAQHPIPVDILTNMCHILNADIREIVASETPPGVALPPGATPITGPLNTGLLADDSAPAQARTFVVAGLKVTVIVEKLP